MMSNVSTVPFACSKGAVTLESLCLSAACPVSREQILAAPCAESPKFDEESCAVVLAPSSKRFLQHFGDDLRGCGSKPPTRYCWLNGSTTIVCCLKTPVYDGTAIFSTRFPRLLPPSKSGHGRHGTCGSPRETLAVPQGKLGIRVVNLLQDGAPKIAFRCLISG